MVQSNLSKRGIVGKGDQKVGHGAMEHLTAQLSGGTGKLCSKDARIRNELPSDCLPLRVHTDHQNLICRKLNAPLARLGSLDAPTFENGVNVRWPCASGSHHGRRNANVGIPTDAQLLNSLTRRHRGNHSMA
jgi:hypothetical protein